MRVLVVSPDFPDDMERSVSGTYQRLRTWLDAARATGADLEVLFFPKAHVPGGPDGEAAARRDLAARWGIDARITLCPQDTLPDRGFLERALGPMSDIAAHPRFRPFAGRAHREALAQSLARSPDTVLFHHLHSMVPARTLELPTANVLLDLDDIEHRTFLRGIQQPPWIPRKAVRFTWVPALWHAERAAIRRARLTFVSGEGDPGYLRRTMGVRNIEIIRNSVAPVPEGPLATEPNVLFLGTYNYRPNVVGAEHLVREVRPHLVRLRPEAHIVIAGTNPEAIPCHAEHPEGVEFTGFVPDLDALYHRTRVVCCTVLAGGGTRIKVLEAASRGIPVVSTTVGAEGIPLEEGSEILLRDDPRAMAEACARLLADHDLARRIGAAARRRVLALFSRDTVIERMKSLLAPEATGPRRGGR
jgi:glycosyltransferase involved in cell wall biosynthesis